MTRARAWARSARALGAAFVFGCAGTPRAADGAWIEPFDGRSLAGWTALGDARFTPAPGGVLGESGGGHHSFLVSDRSWADFELEVDLCNERAGNSGIQVRSHLDAQGHLFGYQIEIDPSPRAWSGGLYDEGRRGWLDDLGDDAAARAAFRSGQWNRYRIRCVGPRIQAWVNGVATADWLDPLDLEGHLALQVHSGSDTRVAWRRLRVRELGRHDWVAARDASAIAARVDAGILGQAAWRVSVPDGAVGVQLALEPDQRASDLGERPGSLCRGERVWTISLPAAPARTTLTLLTEGARSECFVDGRRLAPASPDRLGQTGQAEPDGPARTQPDAPASFALHLPIGWKVSAPLALRPRLDRF